MTKLPFQTLLRSKYFIAIVTVLVLVCSLGLVKLLWPQPQTLPVLTDSKPSTVQSTATEIVEKRTLSSKTFDNHDGTYSSVFTPGPQFYKDANGKLNEISALINQSSNDPEYQLANLSNTFKTHIAAKSDQKYLIKIEKDGAGIELGPEPISGQTTVNPVFGIVRDNTITYPNIYDGIDLRYRITKTRFSTEYIVKNRQAGEKITSLSQRVKLTQLSLEKTANGGLELKPTQQDQEVWADIGSPIIYEESTPEVSTDLGISYIISHQPNDELIVTKTLRPETVAWLVNSKRQYPVVIDPDLTVFPEADPGTVTVDGHVRRSGVDQTFANIRSGAGVANSSSTAQENNTQLTATTTSNQYSVLRRSIYLFDTRSIASLDTITAATFSVYGSAKQNGLGSPELDVVSSNPASNTALANGDYSNLGTTPFGSITYASYSTTGYNDITLTDLSGITKAGITKLGLTLNWDTDNSFTGTWASGAVSSFQGYTADQAGTANDPKLTVTYVPYIVTSFDGVNLDGVNIN